MPKRTRDLDAWLAEQLTDREAASGYINAIIEDSPDLLPSALRDVARARGMARVASDADIPRESLDPMLSESANPTLRNLIAILEAVGLKLRVAAAGGQDQQPALNVGSATNVSAVPPAVNEILRDSANARSGPVQIGDFSSGGLLGTGYSFHMSNSAEATAVGKPEEESLWNQTLQIQQPKPRLEIRSFTRGFQPTSSLKIMPTTSL